MKGNLLFILILVISIVSCSGGSSDDSSKNDNSNTGSSWSEVNWKTADNGAYANFQHNGLAPSCSNRSNTNPAFRFFSRTGTVNKLVVYFQGGGACWHNNNCQVVPNYYYAELQAYETADGMNSIAEGKASLQKLGGILDFSNAGNPFRDWGFVYIPYCTGDLFWGAKDATYDNGTIRHRGHVNFRVVLQWMKNHFSSPETIFVTGISAGSYGAILNFPYIHDAYSSAAFLVLGDGGAGVVNEDFMEQGLPNWDVQLPTNDKLPNTNFTGFDGRNPTELSINDIYSIIAGYYGRVTIAQYTDAWDETQVFFYNVMKYINTPNPFLWGRPENEIQCEWNSKMRSNLNSIDASSDAGNDNFNYFIAPGTSHTALFSPDLYTKTSNGTRLLDWIGTMIDNTAALENVDCHATNSCDRPQKITCSP